MTEWKQEGGQEAIDGGEQLTALAKEVEETQATWAERLAGEDQGVCEEKLSFQLYLHPTSSTLLPKEVTNRQTSAALEELDAEIRTILVGSILQS